VKPTIAAERGFVIYLKPRSHRPMRSGITKLDVMTIIAIVCLLTVNGISALPGLRERARCKQCASRLRDIGLALHAYHDVHHALPPAAFWETSELSIGRPLLGDTKVDRDSIRAIRQNWAQLLLPFLGNQDVAGAFHAEQSIAVPANATARNAALPSMRCPSDSFNELNNPYIVTFSDSSTAAFARGNYAINGGSHTLWTFPGFLCEPAPNGHHMSYDSRAKLFQWWGAGIAGFNKCFSFEDITNGLSTTVAVDEIRAGISSLDPRGAWALGRIGSSVTWAHGVNGDDCGPNNPGPDSDDILMGTEAHVLIGRDRITEAAMPFCDHCNDGSQATARSQHPHGVNALMLDNTVRFISDQVDPGLWHVIHSRETPKEAFVEPLEALLRKTSVEQRATAGSSGTSGHRLSKSSERTPPEITNSIGMRFRRIPPGEFTMGLPDKNDWYPYPQGSVAHRVVLTRPFYLAAYEVTQADFIRVMNRPPDSLPLRRDDTHFDPRTSGRFPVASVTWFDCSEFCARLSTLPTEHIEGRRYRLPTEAEWEYACRGGSTEPYPVARDAAVGQQTGVLVGLDPYAWPLAVSPVGSYAPNRFGLYDMCGNVFEWVTDWYEPGYYARSPFIDPPGPERGYLKVVRGWHWRYIGKHCKWEYLATAPWRRSEYIGFRVVCVVRPE
jgi:formylglycine-generating enzyme required for sulfatase activity